MIVLLTLGVVAPPAVLLLFLLFFVANLFKKVEP